MSKLPEAIRQKFVEWGRQGGNKTKENLGSDHFKKIGKMGGRPKKDDQQQTKREED